MSSVSAERRTLLAKVHIAKSQLRLSDSQYDACLSGFGVESAKDLTDHQLKKLVAYFKHLGWKPKPTATARVIALRKRIESAALELPNGENRLPGLVKKICGVASLAWAKDEAKLKRLLAVIGQQGKEVTS